METSRIIEILEKIEPLISIYTIEALETMEIDWSNKFAPKFLTFKARAYW